MGIWKDVVDTIKDLKVDKIGAQIIAGSGQKGSIAQMANEGILQYPVIASRAIDIETMMMVSKALERNFASFAQVAFSMYGVMDYRTTTSPAEFVRLFHQNPGTELRDMRGLMNKYMTESFADDYSVYENDSMILFGGVFEDATGKIVNLNRDQLFTVAEHLDATVLNDKFNPKRKNVLYNFKDSELSRKYNSVQPLKEAGSLEERKFQYQREIDDIKLDAQERKDAFARASIDLNRNMLSDNDAKKANELVPTIMHIRVKVKDENGADAGVLDFNIGIKAVMHPVKSTEMVTNLVAVCNNKDKLFNFFRWTTGEISFFKDFVLDVNEMKTDVANKSAGASNWWIALKRRASGNKIRKAMPGTNQLLPNSSFVVTMDEVNFINDKYGFNVMDPIFLDKIMKTYFLLGFVVVDNASQIVHFYFDGQTDFESISFSGLEKENSSSERKFKEMLKVINRN